jgi:hypothetical protein
MNIDSFIIQEFITRRKRLVPGTATKAQTKHHALRDGERIAARAEGVAIIHVVADDETGEVSSIGVLERHGLIPEEFEEQVRAV